MLNLKKMIDKKKSEGKEMSPLHAEAKSSVLEDLMNQMDDMGADKIKGLKKVTVSAPDQKGLQHGLEKAVELVQKGPLGSMSKDDISRHGDEDNVGDDHLDDDMSDEELGESPEEESAEGESDESEEDIQNQIKKLQAKLQSKRK